MAKIQRYGIKFPINVNSDEQTLFDLNETRDEKVKSELMHLIFTPKGQRLRCPNFGTRLIQFIFNPNDAETFNDIITEIKETVQIWIPDCTIQDVKITDADNGLTLYVKIIYTVKQSDGSIKNYELISKL